MTPAGASDRFTRSTGGVDRLSAADVHSMQCLAQRVTAVRPELVNCDASLGERAWNWRRGHASRGGGWYPRLWHPNGDLVAWGWATLPHEIARSDGSVVRVANAWRRSR